MSRPRPAQPRPALETMEQRILYAAETALLADFADATQIEQRTIDGAGEFHGEHAAQETSARSEIVFVDARVPDHERIVEDIRTRGDGATRVDVVVLDLYRSGIDQVSEVLAQRQDVSAVHLISHGSEGAIQLGGEILDFDSLLNNATRIKAWGEALTQNADVLIYGCDVGAQGKGQALLDALARLTGADVAASDDVTGAVARGGDWELEANTGGIETPLVLSAQFQAAYAYTWALIAQESFDASGALVGSIGGTGWSGAWSGDAMNVAGPSLSDPTGTLETSGHAAKHTGGALLETERDMGTSAGTPGSTLWMSFLVRPDETDLLSYAGVVLGSPGSGIFAGYQGNEFILGTANSVFGIVDTATPVVSGETAFLVVKVDFAAGNDTATLYVNPTPGSLTPDSPAGGIAVKSDVDLGSFTRVALAKGEGFMSNDPSLDELRIGTTYQDVAPASGVNDAPTGSVTIDDTTPTQGQTLTASNTLADADGLGAISYQWQRGGVDIAGATGATYTTTQADVGAVLRVVASYTDGQGTAESVASADTAAVANVNDAPTGVPTITGTATEDQTLSADVSSIADADGLGAFGYQWQRDGSNIAGATGGTYTLGDADVGANIRVIVSYTDGQGSAESLSSAAVGPIANLNDAPTGSVTIDDTTPTQGQTLTASNTLADLDGLGTVTYQWQRGGVDIAGATGSTYTTTQSDVGAVLRVVASYTDGQGTLESVVSADTAVVANVNDPPTGAPIVTGTPTENQILTADTTTIADADGLGTFSYQWLRDGMNIAGATGGTYTLGDADVGANIRLVVSYTDGYGTAESLTSAAVGPVASVNDAPSGEVLVSGTPTSGSSGSAAMLEGGMATGDGAVPGAAQVSAGVQGQEDQASEQSHSEQEAALSLTYSASASTAADDEDEYRIVVDLAEYPATRARAGAWFTMAPARAALSRADGEFASGQTAGMAGSTGAAARTGQFDLAASADGGLRNAAWMRQLDDVRRSLQQGEGGETQLALANVMLGGGLSVGYVLWLLRGGLLLSTLVSTLPAWAVVDPLPVLSRRDRRDEDDQGDDALERLFARARAALARRPATGRTSVPKRTRKPSMLERNR